MKLVFKIVNFLYVFIFVKLAIQLDICNFVLYFWMLVLCRSKTCVFVLIRFSKYRLDSFIFVLFFFFLLAMLGLL